MVKLLESGEGIAGEDDEDDLGVGDTPSKKKKGSGNGTGTGGKKKPLPATYEPDARSQGWLKVKKGMHRCDPPMQATDTAIMAMACCRRLTPPA